MSDTSTKKEKEYTWIPNVIGILFFSGLAWWNYNSLTRMEANGTVILNKFLTLPYELWGKWAVISFWLLFVLYNIISGLRSYLKEKKIS